MTLREEHLRVLAANGAVRSMTLVQQATGRFQLVVQLDSQVSALTTTRGNPREWASLNKLVDHIRDAYPKVTMLRMELRPATPGSVHA